MSHHTPATVDKSGYAGQPYFVQTTRDRLPYLPTSVATVEERFPPEIYADLDDLCRAPAKNTAKWRRQIQRVPMSAAEKARVSVEQAADVAVWAQSASPSVES